MRGLLDMFVTRLRIFDDPDGFPISDIVSPVSE